MCWGARSLGPSGQSTDNFLARGTFLPLPPLLLRATDGPQPNCAVNYQGVTLIDAVPTPRLTCWFGWSLGVNAVVCFKLLVLSCRHCADLRTIKPVKLQTGSVLESLKGSWLQRCYTLGKQRQGGEAVPWEYDCCCFPETLRRENRRNRVHVRKHLDAGVLGTVFEEVVG